MKKLHFLPVTTLVLFLGPFPAWPACSPEDLSKILSNALRENRPTTSSPTIDSAPKRNPQNLQPISELFSPVVQASLDQATARIIENSGISTRLRQLSQNGKSLSIRIKELAEEPPNNGIGEWIQAHYLAQVLKKIFPEVEILNETSRASMNRTEVTIGIEDITEMRGKTQSSYTVDMQFLKAANGTLSNLQRGEIRESLGIPDNTEVLSMYLNDKEYSPETGKLQKIWEQAVSVNNPQLVIVSFYSRHDTTNILKSLGSHFSGRKVLRVSGTSVDELRQSLTGHEQVVLVNDVPGMMNYFNSASNQAIIAGPNNVFEPLTAGTPTVAFQDTAWSDYRTSTHYDGALAQQHQIAARSGFFRSVKSLEDLRAAILELRGKGNYIPLENRPHLLFADQHQSPVDHLLEHIESVVTPVLNRMMRERAKTSSP